MFAVGVGGVNKGAAHAIFMQASCENKIRTLFQPVTQRVCFSLTVTRTKYLSGIPQIESQFLDWATQNIRDGHK